MRLVFIALLLGLAYGEKIKTISDCNVRVEPSVKSEKVGVTKAGIVFDVTDIQCDYYLVDTGEVKGYASSKFVDTNGMVIGQGVSIRSNDTVKSPILGAAKAGMKVKIIAKIIKWYKIADGWVSADYVSEVK